MNSNIFKFTDIVIIDAGLLWDFVWAKLTSDLGCNLVLGIACGVNNFELESVFGECSLNKVELKYNYYAIN